jgi:uncharacterized protein DUF4390
MAAAVAALLLAVAPPARAELRVSDLDVFLNDFEVTVHTALLGAIPAAVTDGLESGIPTYVRYTVELWQFNRLWRDRLVTSKVVERHLTYNVVTKEFRVTSAKGETRPPYMTRELRDAQRVLSELRGLKLAPASSLDPAEIFYVRVRAETALNGDTSMLARIAGTAEQAMRQSDYRTIQRVQ